MPIVAKAIQLALLWLLRVALPAAGTKSPFIRTDGHLTADSSQGNVAILLDAAAHARRASATSSEPLRTREGSEVANNGTHRQSKSNRTSTMGEASVPQDLHSPRAAPDLSQSRPKSLIRDALGRRRPEDALHGSDSLPAAVFDEAIPRRLGKPFLMQLVGQVVGQSPFHSSFGPATKWLVCLVFGALALVCGCGLAYCQLSGPRPDVLFGYTEAGAKRVCGSSDVDSFLLAYNQAPEHKVRFRFIGHTDVAGGIGRYVRPFSQRKAIAFDISLDLAPFVCDKACVAQPELEIIGCFLAARNVLGSLRIQKRVTWEGWEELAKCVRQRLRLLGFVGEVTALLECDERIDVLWNDPWANFLRSWLVRAVLCMSVVGGLLYLPYMAVRAKSSLLRLQFRIRIEPSQYWDLIKVGVCAEKGFVAG